MWAPQLSLWVSRHDPGIARRGGASGVTFGDSTGSFVGAAGGPL